jgi:hypothetical protein
VKARASFWTADGFVAEGAVLPATDPVARQQPQFFAPLGSAEADQPLVPEFAPPEPPPKSRRAPAAELVVCAKGFSCGVGSGVMIVEPGDRMRRDDPVVRQFAAYFRPVVSTRGDAG